MSLVCGNCPSTLIPAIANTQCNTRAERFDFSRMVVVDCSVFPQADLTDLATWDAIVTADCSKIRISPEGQGTRLAPEANSALIDICTGLETALSYNRSVEFRSTRADLATFTHIDFYNYVFGPNGNNDNLVFMFLSCDGFWYVVNTKTKVELIEDPLAAGSLNYRFVGGRVRYLSTALETPIGEIPGLEALLLAHQAEECPN